MRPTPPKRQSTLTRHLRLRRRFALAPCLRALWIPVEEAGHADRGWSSLGTQRAGKAQQKGGSMLENDPCWKGRQITWSIWMVTEHRYISVGETTLSGQTKNALWINTHGSPNQP